MFLESRMFRNKISLDLQCGSTKKIVGNGNIKTNMTIQNNINSIDEFDTECTVESPCYCHGNFCIKGKYCNAGIALWRGKPICGQNWGDKNRINAARLSGCEDLFCKELGFGKILHKVGGYNGR